MARRTATFGHLDQGSDVSLAAADANCAREPIHVPGTIQPHGVLLAIDPAREFRIVAASRNAESSLGWAVTASRVLGSRTCEVLGLGFTAAMQARFNEGGLRGEAPWQSTVVLPTQPAAFDAAVHENAGFILVELEPADDGDAAAALHSLRQLQEIIVDLRSSGGELDSLARVAARGIRRLTRYERVLIYRFDADWNGQTIAEDRAPSWEQSLEGLHFPASDIPAQARELYRRSQIRWVPDRDATPVPVDAEPGWLSLRPLPGGIDLSFARLRSMSPVHMQFHRNVGVNGSMSLSILHRERLWGLMVCHHREPHHPSPGQRAAAAALTDAFALRVGPAERTGAEQARRGDLGRLSALLAHMAQAEVVTPALTTGDVTIASLFSATGAAVLYDGAVALLGDIPPEPAVRELAAWLRSRTDGATLFQTGNLAAAYPPWEPYASVASGLLAVFLSADRSEMLLWFRPEEAKSVSWGGSPRKELEGALLLPRQSFERWIELRHGFAKPWADWELEMAETLRHGITEVVVRSLRRIADLHEQLRQSQKMEAVGQLTGGIAHDFNNLLTGIIGSLELMRMRVGQGRLGDLDRYFTAAMTSANRAASLTHRLLAFSRRQTLDPKPVDVARLAAFMEELIRRTVGPAIEVVTATPAGLWPAICDANQLENALLNLAINARDAMPDGGRLTIAAANTHQDATSGQYVAVSVTDTGIGMSAEVVDRAFEPFFTTKPLGQGTGLGLSMVYGFTEQSNGYTRIQSEPGRGTTVRLYLPRHLGAGEPEAGKLDPQAEPLVKAGRSVLVVDDELVVRMLIGDMLRDLGYRVIEAADGAAALRVLQSGQTVDLLVSDVGLPGGLNGRQLADAARVHRPRLKVLFITGYAEAALLGKGVLQGDMQVIVKPFAMNILATKIGAMM